jgi:hypothetical protein
VGCGESDVRGIEENVGGEKEGNFSLHGCMAARSGRKAKNG